MDWTRLVHFSLEVFSEAAFVEFLQVHLAGDSRLLISASCCSSFSSRFRGFPGMVSVRDECPARNEGAHENHRRSLGADF
jgi:hypothetical protein